MHWCETVKDVNMIWVLLNGYVTPIYLTFVKSSSSTDILLSPVLISIKETLSLNFQAHPFPSKPLFYWSYVPQTLWMSFDLSSPCQQRLFLNMFSLVTWAQSATKAIFKELSLSTIDLIRINNSWWKWW